MSNKTYIPDDSCSPDSQIGATVDTLYSTIESRREGAAESYTHTLLTGELDKLLKKVSEEALECALAAKDVEAAKLCLNACIDKDAIAADPNLVVDSVADAQLGLDAQIDHLRYECADVVYHILVLAARYEIPLDELAAELNQRMRKEERPQGAVMLKEEHVKRRLN